MSLKQLYNIVALELGRFYTPMQIKWSIDNSLSSAKRFMDKELLYSIFDNYNSAYEITISYLADLIVNYLEKLNRE